MPETFHTCALNQEEKLGKENVNSKVKTFFLNGQLTIPAEDSKGGSRPARGLGGEDKRWGPVGTICLTRRAFWGLGWWLLPSSCKSHGQKGASLLCKHDRGTLIRKRKKEKQLPKKPSIWSTAISHSVKIICTNKIYLKKKEQKMEMH